MWGASLWAVGCGDSSLLLIPKVLALFFEDLVERM